MSVRLVSLVATCLPSCLLTDLADMTWPVAALGNRNSPGLFNALFFGGMGRVSLKCHTPTQTAL